MEFYVRRRGHVRCERHDVRCAIDFIEVIVLPELFYDGQHVDRALCCAEALYCLVDTLMPWFVETFRLQYVAYKSISVFFKHQCAQYGGFYFGVARHKTTCDVGQHGVGASVATSEIISSFII